MRASLAAITPTFRGYVDSPADMLLVLQAVLEGKLTAVPRRPTEIERSQLIISGNVFVFVEELSGIRRWTDGLPWSPSRILGKFLVYRELDKAKRTQSSTGTAQARPVSPMNPTGGSLRAGGLIKKAMSLHLYDEVLQQRQTVHLISYFTKQDSESGLLKTPSTDSFFLSVTPCAELVQALEKSNVGGNHRGLSTTPEPTTPSSTHSFPLKSPQDNPYLLSEPKTSPHCQQSYVAGFPQRVASLPAMTATEHFKFPAPSHECERQTTPVSQTQASLLVIPREQQPQLPGFPHTAERTTPLERPHHQPFKRGSSVYLPPPINSAYSMSANPSWHHVHIPPPLLPPWPQVPMHQSYALFDDSQSLHHNDYRPGLPINNQSSSGIDLPPLAHITRHLDSQQYAPSQKYFHIS
ncbi:LAME_0F07998g1_1 [Lachancea meyersii CBS 8951]|uniref:LAME_0F07998g1_1 n=1 Tax=Lachancea meyersii CBS 8951 TaxID=1266667 RepID=A0A1G4JUE3_9SACH|nr:LAME_0F07998g1_1 [Lachancea meyersii CBS 8951]